LKDVIANRRTTLAALRSMRRYIRTITTMRGRLISYFHNNRQDVLRWGLSAAVVLVAHVSVAAAIVGWNDTDESTDPVGAMVVELAPTPVAPVNTPSDVQPGPEQQQAEATPERIAKPTEKPVDKVVEPEKVKEQHDIPTKENPDVALQKKTPEPQPDKPKPSEAQLAAPVTTAPQMSRVDMAVVAAAPLQTMFNLNDSNAIPTWKRLVASKLERNKKYPSSAQARDEKGVVQLEFSLDRQGRLKSSRIVKSSGSDSLDRETLDLVQRAQPFAAPPAAMTGEEIFLVVPVRFNIH
jgi:protein TonB